MKIYLVGGAVRDEALGMPVTERDWVVVGATPENLLALGFEQVGRDFPVYLHPKTHEEYALARTERKSSRGYHGFECDFNPQVTLEEDLTRRDLTINAMARDDQDQLIDPYQGMRDLQTKCLRHVSAAFVEDPVRVLRIARFQARFHHLGFKIVDETQALMIKMVSEGELNYLVPERVWQEFLCALSTQNPQQFIISLRSSGALKIILPELDALFGVPNAPGNGQYIDTGLQALQSLYCASIQSDDTKVRFAALLLELGKANTARAVWPLHAGFEVRSKELIEKLALRLRVPKEFSQLASLCAQLQTKIQQGEHLHADELVEVLQRADAFRRPARFKQLLQVIAAQVCAKYTENNSERMVLFWSQLLRAIQKVSVPALKSSEGFVIKEALFLARVERAKQQLTQWEQNEE